MINNSYTITLLDILALTLEFGHQEKVFDQVIGQTLKIRTLVYTLHDYQSFNVNQYVQFVNSMHACLHACLFNATCDMVASNFLTELANSYQCISLVTAIMLLCELY